MPCAHTLPEPRHRSVLNEINILRPERRLRSVRYRNGPGGPHSSTIDAVGGHPHQQQMRWSRRAPICCFRSAAQSTTARSVSGWGIDLIGSQIPPRPLPKRHDLSDLWTVPPKWRRLAPRLNQTRISCRVTLGDLLRDAHPVYRQLATPSTTGTNWSGSSTMGASSWPPSHPRTGRTCNFPFRLPIFARPDQRLTLPMQPVEQRLGLL
jgi:hypothetical protein